MNTNISILNDKIYHSKIDQKNYELNKIMDHAVLAISPFNSYFKEDIIAKLVEWAINNFKDFKIFIPEGWSKYTLVAQGYSEEKASKKTRLHDSNLKNKVIRALERNGIPTELSHSYFVTPQTLMSNEDYCDLYEMCVKKYNDDETFKKVCRSASTNLLSKSNGTVTEDMLDVAVNYILRELPIYLDSPKILNVSSSFMVYHKVSDVDKYIYQHDSISATNQSYIVAEITE